MLNQIFRRTLKIVMWILGIGAGAAAVMLLILMISEYKPRSEETVEIKRSGEERIVCEGDQIRLLTFNIGYGGLDASMDSFMDGGKMNTPGSREQVEGNLEGMISLIGSREYDVLFLQEVDRYARRSYYIDESALFEERLGGVSMYAQDISCLFVPYPIPDVVGRLSSGVQTHTELNVRSAERIALPTSFKWPARVCQPKRCLLVTRVPVEDSGRELVLVNVHMDAYDDGSGKAAQTQALAEFVQAEYEAGNYVIVGGDFNQAFPDDNFSAYPIRSDEYFMPGRLEREMFEGDWTFASDRSNPTCRLLDVPYASKRWWTQFYVVDGFILSPNVTLENVETIDADFAYSDHNPVELTVRLGE